jgi:protein-disulfide isomerase
MSRNTWIILGMIVVLIAGGGALFYFNKSDATQTASKPADSFYDPLPTDHTFGNPKAGVTVIEYASPTCPVCANFTMNLYPRLKSDYIDKGRIFYVYRTFLRNPDDASAEKLARCLPKEKYMAFTELLFRSQQKWDYEYGVPSPDGVHAALLELVATMGMSKSDADQCLAATKDEEAISKVGEDGVAKYNIAATPTFVINGRSEAGFEDFFSRLDAALAK